jgi:hypothetical protein
MRQPPPHLEDLVGKPLWASGRAANLQWFQFGRRRMIRSSLPSRRGQEKEVGELALHVQAPWRLRTGATIVVGSYDLHFPRGVYELSKIPDDFDSNKSPTRRDELIEDVQRELLPAEVTEVIVGVAGSFTLIFGATLSMDVFPNSSVQSEHWRLFAPGDDDREHLVHGLWPDEPPT